jgi:hypothetical protein
MRKEEQNETVVAIRILIMGLSNCAVHGQQFSIVAFAIVTNANDDDEFSQMPNLLTVANDGPVVHRVTSLRARHLQASPQQGNLARLGRTTK